MEKFSSAKTNLTFTSIESLITSMCLVLTIIFSCLCGISTVEGSLNLKHHVYEASGLCPDLQDSILEYDENSQDKSSFQLFKYLQPSEFPCLLKNSARGVQKRIALIAGIHADPKPWKFSSDAKTCRENIKVRLPKYYRPAKREHDFEMVCRVPKRPEFFVNLNITEIGLVWFVEFALLDMDYPIIPPHKTPSLYNLRNKKLLIHFSNVNLTHSNDSDLVFSEHLKDYWFQRDRILQSLTNFIKIIFIVRTAAGDCYVQVQQYLQKGPNESSCEYLHQRHPFSLCGVYGCDKIMDILYVEDFWSRKTEYIPKKFQPGIEIRGNRPGSSVSGSKIVFVLMLFLIKCMFCACRTTNHPRPTNASGDDGSQIIDNCNRNSDIVTATARPPPTTTEITDNLRIHNSSSGGGGSRISSSNINPVIVTIRPPTTTTVVTNHDVIPVIQTGTEEDLPPPYDCLYKLPTYEDAIML